MAALSLRRALLLLVGAAASSLVSAQTIVTGDGTVVAADEASVAPAASAIANTTSAPAALQLTDAVIANLTDLQLSNISLFAFQPESSEKPAATRRAASSAAPPVCKVFPGDAAYPSRLVWAVLDLLTGGALIETVPIGAACYPQSGAYNNTKCAAILAHWTESDTHAADPTSVMSPLFQGETCMPAAGAARGARCTLGGFPSYAVKISNVAQVQLAVNFARNSGVRLVVKNTGHDFLGKSCGAGALSIWTHHLKTIEYVARARTPAYSGPALRLGAGVEVHELYRAADKYNVTAVGGECRGVGVAGGYTAGGGHSPLSSRLGMGADQVLSVDVVLPSGRFVTADETTHPDLFWALRGGGGATFGVVTAMTVKVHPRMAFAGANFTVASGPDTNVSEALFWNATYAYWRKMPEYAARGSYGYSTVFPRGPPGAGYTWSMLPWLVPGMALAEFQAMVAPLLAEWNAMGLAVTPLWFEHDSFYDTWSKGNFPLEGVANSNLRTGSRLFPASVWEDSARLAALLGAMKSIVVEGSALIQYNINGKAPAGTPASATNTHWRDAVWYTIIGAAWSAGVSEAEVKTVNVRITDDWMGRLRPFGPGGYGNEGDVMEPDFGGAFFGTNYDRLLEIKRSVDPDDVFWAPTAVGSDRWQVSGQRDWLTLQTGKLCKRA
ncbi:hypothetical protein B0H67DRAFT_94421 [Lasiosphaeris hirsuta]|uniref:FAD-binding PCMH-type domain-containing protein n=1 Tax=Lasiosphaeris hirsuta TaxID=260670 RepID=A0AA40BDF2_9PEZI|nr:hypothetical protein B0H67DRAFT_94421 [Lasiosphaeris hirsuta]